MGVVDPEEQEPYGSLFLVPSPMCSLVSAKATRSLKEDGDNREESTRGSAQELTDQQIPGDSPVLWMLCQKTASHCCQMGPYFSISPGIVVRIAWDKAWKT